MLEYGLLTVTCSSVLILLVEILQLSGFEYPISYVKRRDKVCRIHSVSYADFNTADIIQYEYSIPYEFANFRNTRKFSL